MVARTRRRVDGLDACGVVDVGDGGNVRPRHVQELDAPQVTLIIGQRRAPPRQDRCDEQHVGAIGVHLEVVGEALPEDGRREGPEGLPVLDLEVHDRLHPRIPRIAENAAASERAGPELHPALEPADDLARREVVGDLPEEVFLRHAHVRGVLPGEEELDLLVRVCRAQEAAAHAVAGARRDAGLPVQAVPGGQRDAHRPAGIARGGLDPQAPERTVSQDLAIAHTVEGDATGEAEMLGPRLAVQGASEAEHHLLGDVLDGSGQVHLPLGQQRLRLAGRGAEERVELAARHGEPGAVVEVLHVEPEGAVRLQVQQMIEDGVDVLRAPIGRQAHHLVLAGVDLEAEVVGEGRVEEADRVREGDLPERGQLAAVAEPGRRGGPLTDPIHAQHRRGGERRRIECRRRVGFVVLAEEEMGKRRRLASVGQGQQLLLQEALQEHLLLEPDRHGRHEGPDAARGERQVGLQQALELDQGLVVEGDVAEIAESDPALAQAVAHRVDRESRIVLLPGEALFLGGGDDLAVAHEACCAVMVEGGDAEDIRRHGRLTGVAGADESSPRTLSRRHAATAAFPAGAK